MSDFREVLESVRLRPRMYFGRPTFDVAVGFILGFDMARESGTLLGFREWMIPRVGDGNSLGWPLLVLYLLFPQDADPVAAASASAEREQAAFDGLFRLLLDFDDARRAPNGLRKIFSEYEKWLQSQSWYGPGSPPYLD
jgi:hypothetical protein